MRSPFFRKHAMRLGVACLIASTGLFLSLAPSRAGERPEQKQQVAKSKGKPKGAKTLRRPHRDRYYAAAPRHYWQSGFDDPIYDGWDDDQSPDFGVSLGNGCWDLPQYARLYGCDQNDLGW